MVIESRHFVYLGLREFQLRGQCRKVLRRYVLVLVLNEVEILNQEFLVAFALAEKINDIVACLGWGLPPLWEGTGLAGVLSVGRMGHGRKNVPV